VSPRFLAVAAIAFAPLLSQCAAERPTGPDSSPTSLGGPTYIVSGLPDQANAYASVGAFIVRNPTSGQIFPICSGTLIAPTVFVTAAHCTAYFEGVLAPAGYTAHVSFDNPIPFGGATDPQATTLIGVTGVATNPGYNQRQSDPGDLAVLRLDAGGTVGITPARLPTAGLLDALAARGGLHGARFTAVGYGLQDRLVGGGPPRFQDPDPVPRMFAISSFNALGPGYLRLSQNPSTGDGGGCYGDSGGPNFLVVDGVRILVTNTITGDAVCRATNVTIRLDTQTSRAFLGQFMALP